MCTMARRSRAAGPPSPAAVALYAQPSDVTLLKDILRPWVISGDTKAGGAGAYVHAADVYSADPDELARRFVPAVSPDGGDCTWYFLSPLRNKSPRDRRKVRAVADGTGCWHSEAAPRNVVDHLDGGRHVGYRQAFSFMRRHDDGAEVRAGWIMTEFHLHHYDDLSGRGRKVEGLVLCKVYRSPRNRGHVHAVAPDCGNDDIGSGMSPSAETRFYCSQHEVVDNEDSNGMTSRWPRRINNPDDTATSTMMTAVPLLEKKAASDKDVSGVTTTTAPCPKNKAVAEDDDNDLLTSSPARKKMRMAVVDTESSGAVSPLEAMVVDAPALAPCPNNKAVAVDNNDDLLTSSPTHKKMRVAVVDVESSGAVSPLKTTAASAPAAMAQLHCPQCGFHLAALQALVTLTKSKSVVSGEMHEI